MEQINNFGDDRNKGFCIHCGGADETRDHIPSKVLLDEPYPTNMHVVPSCLSCNNALSADEQYVACLIECVLVGDTNPIKIPRPRIGKLLAENPLLRERIERAKSLSRGGSPIWSIEEERVKAVVLKLARGHAAYELNEPQVGPPEYIDIRPLVTMSESERMAFEQGDGAGPALYPEVGSRAMQRMFEGQDLCGGGWVLVQDGNYRFRTSQDNGLTIQMVIREYLGCQVGWA